MSQSTSLPRLCPSITLPEEDSVNSYNSSIHEDDVEQDSAILKVQQMPYDEAVPHSENTDFAENSSNKNGEIKKYNYTPLKVGENSESCFPSSQEDQNDNEPTSCGNPSETQEINKKKDIPEDIINFYEAVKDLLECPVCMNHMVPPILLCESGHNVCYKCKPFMTRCPQCRGSFIQTRNVALEYISQKLNLSCINEDDNYHDQKCAAFNDDQVMYTCPLTLFSHCYWQGSYSDIRRHVEETHASKMLNEGEYSSWEMKLVVKDFKVIFALDEIFFYKERLDTANSKFYIQVFYIGQRVNHNNFSYQLELRTEFGQQRLTMENKTLPIYDLEHTYTYSDSHCIVIDYQIVSDISKYGDLKCVLSLARNPTELTLA